MNILIIGKFPPIQGGTSSICFWTSLRLGSEGNKVFILSNAAETENNYRQCFLPEDQATFDRNLSLQGVFPASTEPLAFEPVPAYKAYESKLYALGCEILTSEPIDAIIGWYLLPYGWVASLLARNFKKNLTIITAGSDIHAGLGIPALQPLLRSIAEASNTFFTPQSVHLQLSSLLGPALVPKLSSIHRGILPTSFRLWEKDGFSARDYLDVGPVWFTGFQPALAAATLQFLTHQQLPSDKRPVIGFYGKIGPCKGLFELILALDELLEEGLDFTLVCAIGGESAHIENLIRVIMTLPNLAKRILILPLLPVWKVASFIASCDMICILEHRFPIHFHMPITPLEVLSEGTCLVCSREIATKLRFYDNLQSGKNFIEIEDPANVQAFKHTLGPFLGSPSPLKTIGSHGNLLFRSVVGFTHKLNMTEYLFPSSHGNL